MFYCHLPIQSKIVVPHSVVGSMDLAVEGHDESDRVFGNRIRRISCVS